jgi:hypothetical protein
MQMSMVLAASDSGGWESFLVVSLVASAVLALGYRVYRLRKGGPAADVAGGALLGALLVADAVLVAAGHGWARWPALVYGLLFGLLATPVWVLAVYIPSRPAVPEHFVIALYYLSLIAIVVSSLAL